MTRAEAHYLNCQDDNCEFAYCVARRAYEKQIESLKQDHTGWKALAKENGDLVKKMAQQRNKLVSLLKSAYGFVEKYDNVGHTAKEIGTALKKYKDY